MNPIDQCILRIWLGNHTDIRTDRGDAICPPLKMAGALKKTSEGHLKQIREGLRNNFFLFGLRKYLQFYVKIVVYLNR